MHLLQQSILDIFDADEEEDQIQPVNELLIEVDGAHHPPVDVAVPASDRWRVHLSPATVMMIMIIMIIMVNMLCKRG